MPFGAAQFATLMAIGLLCLALVLVAPCARDGVGARAVRVALGRLSTSWTFRSAPHGVGRRDARPGLISAILLVMSRMRLAWATAGLVAAALLLRARPGWDQASVEVSMQTPAFPTSDPKHWIGTPVSWKDLRGKVVVLDVWTFG